MAEVKEELKTAVVKAQAQEEAQNLESQHQKVLDNLGNIYADRLKMKAAELEAIEKAMDEKMKDYKDFINKTALSGKGIIALEKTQKDVEEEKLQDRINKFRRCLGR